MPDSVSAGSWQALAAYSARVPLSKATSGDRAAAFTPARRANAIGLAALHSHAKLWPGTNTSVQAWDPAWAG